MMDEVRYHMLRPNQVVERRHQCPVAYIPIGTLEWHGVHLPLGADTLQAEGIAVQCAKQGGGLVFPPLYYGESRLEGLMESNASDREQIAQHMEVSPENFTAQRHPYSAAEQALNYHKLLLHILAEAESLGFELGVLVAGHYPLIDHARAAVLQFNQRDAAGRSAMLAWAFVDYLLVQDRYPLAGDHAACWETSHVLALHPETVAMDALAAEGADHVGVGGRVPPEEATASYGEEILAAAVDVAVQEVRHRLAHPSLYRQHGRSLLERQYRGVGGDER